MSKIASGKTREGIPVELFDAIFLEKRSILLNGPSGCGKSYMCRLIKNYCDKNGINCAITSTTGVSAYDIGGTTVHRWASIQLGDKPLKVICEKIRKNKENYKRWKETDILIIDEVSMLGSDLLDYLDAVAKDLRGGKSLLARKNLAFGGLQVIFTGDFLQLRPVNGEFAFKSHTWERMNLYYFRMIHPYRYPDIDHFHMLMRIREGKQTEEDYIKLEGRVKAYNEWSRNIKLQKSPIKPTILFSLKRDVEFINVQELNKLEGETFIFEADDTIIPKKNERGELVVKPSEIKENDYILYMDQIVAREITLKVKAQVMLTKNLDVELGLVNGARGVVSGIEEEFVKVLFSNNLEVSINAFPYEFEDEKAKIVRCQFPLILASAISVHKSQGATIDCAIIDLGTTLFAPAMGFVALSRIKTLEGCFIKNLVRSKIIADEEALEFEKQVVEKSICFVPLEQQVEAVRETNDKEEDDKEPGGEVDDDEKQLELEELSNESDIED